VSNTWYWIVDMTDRQKKDVGYEERWIWEMQDLCMVVTATAVVGGMEGGFKET